MISKKTYFSKEGSRGVQDEFKNDGFRASEFHGAFRDRVFSFCWRQGVPLERPRLASWQMMMDILDVFERFCFSSRAVSEASQGA